MHAVSRLPQAANAPLSPVVPFEYGLIYYVGTVRNSLMSTKKRFSLKRGGGNGDGDGDGGWRCVVCVCVCSVCVYVAAKAMFDTAVC